MLAIMYFEGNGVPQDLDEAEKWARNAALADRKAGIADDFQIAVIAREIIAEIEEL